MVKLLPFDALNDSLLQAMDSFDSSKSIVIAASNHQYLLDPALWRRFDDLIEFSLPTKTEREFYLQRLLNGVYFDGSLEYIAKNMSSLSYADIQRITIEAIKTMILEGREQLQSQDISEQLKAFRKESLGFKENRGIFAVGGNSVKTG